MNDYVEEPDIESIDTIHRIVKLKRIKKGAPTYRAPSFVYDEFYSFISESITPDWRY